MSDTEIIEHVVAVKHREWTAQMFAFMLARPDVLPTGDLGIQKHSKVFHLRPPKENGEAGKVLPNGSLLLPLAHLDSN